MNVGAPCEELNNSPQIEAAADGRPLTSYAANPLSNGAAKRVWRQRMESERVWRPRMELERVWRPRTESEKVWRQSMENERERRLRGQGKSAVCKNRITELHRTLDSPVNFGLGEEVPNLGSGGAHRRATSGMGISGMAAVGGASIGSGT